MPKLEPDDASRAKSISDADRSTSPSSDNATVEEMVCATCGEALNRYWRFGEVAGEWRHPLNQVKDHPPAPIPRAAAEFVVMYCDFCSSVDVAWTYRTRTEIRSTLAKRNFTDEVEERRISQDWMTKRSKEGPPIDLAVNTFSQDWAACERCAELIELRDMERLITHLRRTNANLARTTRTLLRQHFGPFFRAIGGREPVRASAPPPGQATSPGHASDRPSLGTPSVTTASEASEHPQLGTDTDARRDHRQ